MGTSGQSPIRHTGRHPLEPRGWVAQLRVERLTLVFSPFRLTIRSHPSSPGKISRPRIYALASPEDNNNYYYHKIMEIAKKKI